MKIFAYLFAAAILTASCKKSVTELPAATQTGANTFGAKVNGEFWVPQKFGVVPTAPLLEARFNGTGGLFINARNFASSPTETEFEIFIKDIHGEGNYPLNQDTGVYPSQSASYGYYIKRKINPLNEWITGSTNQGLVSITKYDTVNRIVSGNFEFTAGSIDHTADPVSVTEGRFDIKIQ